MILPEFERPPVVEVVLSVGFEPLEELSNVALTDTWSQLFRDRFPKAEERPPYSVPVEGFERRSRPVVQMTAISGPPPTRFWFTSETGSELIQLQSNWYARNWRKVGEGDSYPRYEHHIRPAFLDDLSRLVSFVESRYRGKLLPTQCELTYINHIAPLPGVWVRHGDIGNVFETLEFSQESLTPEALSLNASQVIVSVGEEGIPLGRLHVSIDSAFRDPDEPIFRFNLTARGAPFTRDLQGVAGFLDMGRERIAAAFLDWTTDEAQSAWGRTK